MKKMIRKIKDWLIWKLGGFTEGDVIRALKLNFDAYFEELTPWRKTVQELCRRGDSSYYDWACEYCTQTCDKRNGWCARFYPCEEEIPPHEEREAR